jgi:hypothetical protein
MRLNGSGLRFIVSICLLVFLTQGCATFPSQQNINSVQLGMTPYQVNALLGNPMDMTHKLDYDVARYSYFDEFGTQRDILFAVFRNGSLVGLFNLNNYFSWKESEFMRLYSDPSIPQATRDAYKFEYEQDQANNRAKQQAMAKLLLARAMAAQQSSYQTPVTSNCKGYAGVGGPCYAGVGGPMYAGVGGPAYAGVGGPAYAGVGGPKYAGVGGPEYAGVGGPKYAGVGGPAYNGVGGPAYTGVGGPCYDGVGGPCYGGVGGGNNCPSICQQ